MCKQVRIYVVEFDDLDNGSSEYELFLSVVKAQNYILKEVNNLIQDMDLHHKPFTHWWYAKEFASKHDRIYKIVDKVLTA